MPANESISGCAVVTFQTLFIKARNMFRSDWNIEAKVTMSRNDFLLSFSAPDLVAAVTGLASSIRVFFGNTKMLNSKQLGLN